MGTEIEIIDGPQLPVRQSSPTLSPARLYLSRLSSGSRPATEARLKKIVSIVAPGADVERFPWHQFDYSASAALRVRLAESLAPATANATLAALRGVLLESWRLGLMSAEQRERASDIAPVRGKRLPKGRALSSSELRDLFAACPDTPAGDRDAALLAVLYSGGLRRAEAAALDLADYDASEGSITVRAGKGNKARIVYLTDGAIARLNTYVNRRGSHPGPLFHRIHGGAGALMLSTRITAQAVRFILQSRCRDAGVADCSPHDMRRSMISDLLDNGADISTVQQIAGHSSVSTTQRYDRRGERTKRAAAQRLTVPEARMSENDG